MSDAVVLAILVVSQAGGVALARCRLYSCSHGVERAARTEEARGPEHEW